MATSCRPDASRGPFPRSHASPRRCIPDRRATKCIAPSAHPEGVFRAARYDTRWKSSGVGRWHCRSEYRRKPLRVKKRVATVPDVVEKLIKLGFSVAVESGAGDAANFADDTYSRGRRRDRTERSGRSGPRPTSSSRSVHRVPTKVALMREGGTLIGFVWPAQNPALMQQLAGRKATVLAIDALPRQLSRAQKMDALTSMAGISGYRAVIEAANVFDRFFNGQITAAGKIPPAKVFVAGAGVAGLAAIGTAANLGANRARQRHARRGRRPGGLAGRREFVKVDYEEEGSGGGWLREGDERGLPDGATCDVRASRPGKWTSSSRRR